MPREKRMGWLDIPLLILLVYIFSLQLVQMKELLTEQDCGNSGSIKSRAVLMKNVEDIPVAKFWNYISKDTNKETKQFRLWHI